MKTKLPMRSLVFVIALNLILGLLSCPRVASASSSPLIDLRALKGVDTIVVADNFGPGAAKLLNVDHLKTRPIVLNVLQGVFSDANSHLWVKDSWLSIKPALHMDIHDLQKPDVLLMSFVISAREEHVDGKAVTVGALSLTLTRSDPEGSKALEIAGDATYPFLVPSNPDELEKPITDGVKFLTSFLPSYLVCANKYGHKSGQCPDCEMSACHIDEPYGEE